LEELIEYGAIGIKCGTEAESQGWEMIGWIVSLLLEHGLSQDLPVRVKIGGPEALNDVEQAYTMDITRLRGPMIGDAYGVKKIVGAARNVGHKTLTNGGFNISINIETINGFLNRREIIRACTNEDVTTVYIGKSDLSLNMGADPNDEVILQMARMIVEEAKKNGLRTGVGGRIVPSSVRHVIKVVRSDEIETRHVVFDVQRLRNPEEAIKAALRFEWLLYEAWKQKLTKEIYRSHENRDFLLIKISEGPDFQELTRINAELETLASQIRYGKLQMGRFSQRQKNIVSRLGMSNYEFLSELWKEVIK